MGLEHKTIEDLEKLALFHSQTAAMFDEKGEHSTARSFKELADRYRYEVELRKEKVRSAGA